MTGKRMYRPSAWRRYPSFPSVSMTRLSPSSGSHAESGISSAAGTALKVEAARRRPLASADVRGGIGEGRQRLKGGVGGATNKNVISRSRPGNQDLMTGEI